MVLFAESFIIIKNVEVLKLINVPENIFVLFPRRSSDENFKSEKISIGSKLVPFKSPFAVVSNLNKISPGAI